MFNGLVNFQKVIFKGPIAFSLKEEIQSPVFSWGSIEKRIVDFSVFKNEVNFSEVEFFDEVLFYGAIFEKQAIFYKTKFHKTADFSNSIFKLRSIFNKSLFKLETHFINVQFATSDFCNSKFFGKTLFDHATFKNDVEFWDAIFYDQISFNNATFEGKADFFNITNKKIIFFRDTKLYNDLNFTNSFLEKPLILDNLIINNGITIFLDGVTINEKVILNLKDVRKYKQLSLSLYLSTINSLITIDKEIENIGLHNSNDVKKYI